MKKQFALVACLMMIFSLWITGVALSDAKNAWQTDDDGIRRYYDEFGYRANGAFPILNYETNETDYYYFLDGVPQTGWIDIYRKSNPAECAGKGFYMEDGKAAQRWMLIDGEWYMFNYISSGGILVTHEGTMDSEDVGWINDNGRVKFVLPYPDNDLRYYIINKGYDIINGKEYRLDPEGYLLYGWQKSIDGYPIYCGDDGVITKGFRTIDGKDYFFNMEDGSMTIGEKYITVNGQTDKYTFDTNGVLIAVNDPSTYTIPKNTWHTDEDGIRRYYDDRGYKANGPVSVYNADINNSLDYYFVDGIPQTGWIDFYRNANKTDYAGKGYYKEDGTAADRWMLIDGEWYMFNYISSGGILVTHEGTMDSEDVGWINDNGRVKFVLPYPDNDLRYYIINKGYDIINGKEYRLDPEGYLLYGWQKSIDGYPIYCGDDGVITKGFRTIDGKDYFFNMEDGSMTIGEKYITVNGQTDKYTFDTNGVLIAVNDPSTYTIPKNTWHTDEDGIRRYYDDRGYKANGPVSVYNADINNSLDYYFVDGIPQTGWIDFYRNANKTDYAGKGYYKEDGTAAERWMLIDGKWHLFNYYSSGGILEMAENQGITDSAEIGWVYDNDRLKFVVPYPDEYLKSRGYDTINGKTYRFDTDGYLLYGWQENRDGRPIYCGEDGVITKGFRTIDGNEYYFDMSDGTMAIGDVYITIAGQMSKYTFDENGVLLRINGFCVEGKHEFATEVEAVAPTENESGRTAGIKCIRCGKTIASKLIPPLRDMTVLKLPDSLKVIQENAFENTDCQAVIIPEGCVSIEEYAFKGCHNLLYVFIPATVENISENAFADSNGDAYILFGGKSSD